MLKSAYWVFPADFHEAGMLNKELEAPFIMLVPEQEGSENIKDDKPFRLGG